MSESVSGLLQTAAEISVAFVGFASLIGVFVARTGGQLSLHARLTLRSLLDYGLLALLGCAVPLLLLETSISEPSLWRLSSFLMASLILAYYLISRGYYREVRTELSASRSGMAIAFIVGDGLIVILLGLNSTGWIFEPSVALYSLSAVFWNIFGAAMSFRLVIDIAWSSSSESE